MRAEDRSVVVGRLDRVTIAVSSRLDFQTIDSRKMMWWEEQDDLVQRSNSTESEGDKILEDVGKCIETERALAVARSCVREVVGWWKSQMVVQSLIVAAAGAARLVSGTCELTAVVALGGVSALVRVPLPPLSLSTTHFSNANTVENNSRKPFRNSSATMDSVGLACAVHLLLPLLARLACPQSLS